MHVADPKTRKTPLVTSLPSQPSYAQLQDILKAMPGSGSSKDWATRLRDEWAFNRDSMNNY